MPRRPAETVKPSIHEENEKNIPKNSKKIQNPALQKEKMAPLGATKCIKDYY